MNPSFYELAATDPDEAAEIAVRAAATLNRIVDVFGPDAVDWIRAELLRNTRSYTDRNGDTWIENADSSLSMLDGAGVFQDWPFDEVQRVYGPLTQQSGDPLPVVHATSRWQRVLGRLGVRTRAWCGERIVAGEPADPSRKCRECERWT
jgi:hypothetical protein